LRNAIKAKWCLTETDMIRKAIMQWKHRLHAVSEEKGRPVSVIKCNYSYIIIIQHFQFLERAVDYQQITFHIFVTQL